MHPEVDRKSVASTDSEAGTGKPVSSEGLDPLRFGDGHSRAGSSHASTPKAGFLRAIRAVAAAFFGVRAREGHEADLAQLRPFQLVVVGLLMAALFVLLLIALVTWVVRPPGN